MSEEVVKVEVWLLFATKLKSCTRSPVSSFPHDKEPDQHRKLTAGVKGRVRQDSKSVLSNSWGQGGAGTYQGQTVHSIQCGALSLPFCFHVECLALFFIKYMYYTNDIVATLTRILNKREEIFLVLKP